MSRQKAATSRQRRSFSAPGARAFTLIELLVVIGIIAVISSMLVPAVQGIMGTSGRRGGLNTVTAVLEQARLAAIENGTTVYVGFPTEAQNKTNAFSHVIVYRDARPDDSNTSPVALTRWQRLPTGVFYQFGDNFSAALAVNSVPSRTFPKLGGTEDVTRISALAFNRFGQLKGINQEVVLLLGEKIEPTGDWRGGRNNFFQMRIQPLTGRTIVRDAGNG